MREPTIALINVVFLMLVFFLLAGTITPPLDRGVSLVETSTLDASEPPEALVIHADGRMTWRGSDVDASDLPILSGEERAFRIVPDRELPAVVLLDIATTLQRLGANDIRIVTERGLR